MAAWQVLKEDFFLVPCIKVAFIFLVAFSFSRLVLSQFSLLYALAHSLTYTVVHSHSCAPHFIPTYHSFNLHCTCCKSETCLPSYLLDTYNFIHITQVLMLFNCQPPLQYLPDIEANPAFYPDIT